MESSHKVLFKFDRNVFKENGELKDVVFNEPRLVAYKELNYDILQPGKKIFYFKKPKPSSYPIDLNLGFRTYTEILPSFEFSLKAPLQYVMSSSGSEDANVDKIKIFTLRGSLMDLMENVCPQSNTDHRVFHVTRYNGDLYMLAKRFERREGPVKPHHSHDAQFLKNVFAESFKNEPNTDEPFDANKMLLGVFQSCFGEFELIYSSPIYGIQTDDELKDFADMEALNSCRFVMAKQMWWNRRNDPAKHLDYYLQARLANVKDLYLAYKNDNGIVGEPIVHKRASDLANEYKFCWKPSICFDFLYSFFKKVNKLMSKDDVNSFNTVYEFDVVPRELTVTYKIFKDKPEMNLVTPEYVKYCQEKFEN